MEARSHSTSALLTTLLDGPAVNGTVFSGHELRFGDYIVAITASGAARMPNGFELKLALRPRTRVSIGQGRLVVAHTEIAPGPGWDPVPRFDPIDCLPPGLPPATRDSATVLAGYLAGLVLLHRQRARAEDIAARSISAAVPAEATLLMHAARGEVPEPVHTLLSTRDASQLVSWSHLGIAWLRGFVSAGLPIDLVSARVTLARRTA